MRTTGVHARASCLALACALASSSCEEPPYECAPPDELDGIRVTSVDRVDLLFMIDNSSSMTEEQRALASELPRMLRMLATGDVNEDGDDLDDEDFDGVRDLNVGVITSDMGTGGHTVPTCARSDFGDDGLLRTQGRADLEGCSATYPNIVNFRIDGGSAPEDFAREVACVATVGTGGCGFEQPLEAILKALTPTRAQAWTSPGFVPPGDPSAPEGLARPFFADSRPHGNVQNDGFLRDGSILAIIPLTDEEDCSAHDPELFDPASSRYAGTDLNLRCYAHPEALHPIERYVNGFLQLRRRPSQLVFAPIVGVPIDLAPEPGTEPDWTALTSPDCKSPQRDPRLCERVDPMQATRLVPSCDVPGRGLAFAPIRIARVARELAARGAGVTVQSICGDSYASALDEVVRHVRSALAAECLPGPELPVDPDGSVACDLFVALPSGMSCELDGYEALFDVRGEPAYQEGRALCTIRQLVPASREPGTAPPAGAGWYYDTFTLSGDRGCDRPATEVARVVFAGAQPPSGSSVSFVCPDPSSAVGTPCLPDVPAADPCPELTSSEGTPLSCDPWLRGCGVTCEGSADCRDAGLVGWDCDTRSLAEIDPWLFAGDERTYGFCRRPTCD